MSMPPALLLRAAVNADAGFVIAGGNELQHQMLWQAGN